MRRTLHIRLLILLLAGLPLAGLPLAGPVAAQGIPQDPAAERVFEEALRAFEAQDFEQAYRQFRTLVNNYPLNRKTTAAWLMAGKALYQLGDYQASVELLDLFMEAYPTSRYVEVARQTHTLALEAQALAEREDQVINLGIALPLSSGDEAFTQALFNGLRLAVDAHNQGGTDRPVRMLFQATDNDRVKAAQAVNALVQAGADVIIGPLFSREAESAAATAEAAGVVLVAPLATDASVSAQRRYVFQSNPTLAMRGRIMARFAMDGLRMNHFGIVAERRDPVGEVMAEGFQDEALRRGAEVRFFHLIDNTSDWYRLQEHLTLDTLANVQGLYLPISGNNAPVLIGAALDGLNRLGTSVRVLGNKEWHDLPFRSKAGDFATTYSNDFFADPTKRAIIDFKRRYYDLTGDQLDNLPYAAGRLPYVGYDVTQYILKQLVERPGVAADQAFREAAPYEGLATRIDFKGSNINQYMFFHRYRDARLELLY